MKRLTIYSWGYYGWGNAPEKFVQAVDAVERSRGFKPPLFVEVRIQRTGRAEGFKGSNFEKLLGPKRYRWMKELGNVAIKKRSGPMKIADPSAASQLLDLAVAEAKKGRRLLFFCGCQWPCICHRSEVSSLLLNAAEKQGIPIEVVEWPGGTPSHVELKVPAASLKAIRSHRVSIPLGDKPQLAKVAGLAWGSTVTLQSGKDRVLFMTGPATFERGQWVLTVYVHLDDPSVRPTDYKDGTKSMRKELGVEPARS